MSGAATRFLFVAVAGWAVVRGATLGALPGAQAFVSEAEAAPPPVAAPTSYPVAEPVQTQPAAFAPEYAAFGAQYGVYGPYAGRPQAPQAIAVPVYYYPANAPARTVHVPLPPAQPEPPADAPPDFYAPIPRLDEWQTAGISAPVLPDWRGAPAAVLPDRTAG